MKEGAPSCGLYLRIEADPDMAAVIPALRQAGMVVNRSEYERNMHVIEVQDGAPGDEGEVLDKAAALVELARAQGMTAIMRGSATAARVTGADGVLLDSLDDYALAREVMGEAAIVGMSCRMGRALAGRAREAGADYVSFGLPGQALPPPDLIGWWSTLTDIPVLAAGPVDNDNAGAFVRAGATFLDCWAYIRGHEKGVLQGTVNMLYAIDLALENLKVN